MTTAGVVVASSQHHVCIDRDTKMSVLWKTRAPWLMNSHKQSTAFGEPGQRKAKTCCAPNDSPDNMRPIRRTSRRHVTALHNAYASRSQPHSWLAEGLPVKISISVKVCNICAAHDDIAQHLRCTTRQTHSQCFGGKYKQHRVR